MAFWCPRCKRELNFAERCQCGGNIVVDPTVIKLEHILKWLRDS